MEHCWYDVAEDKTEEGSIQGDNVFDVDVEQTNSDCQGDYSKEKDGLSLADMLGAGFRLVDQMEQSLSVYYEYLLGCQDELRKH